MEVENPTLPSFDLQSEPSFSFNLNVGMETSKFRSEEHSSSETSLAFNGDAVVKTLDVENDLNSEVSVDLLPNGVSMGSDSQAYECSESDFKVTHVDLTMTDAAKKRESSESSVPLSPNVQSTMDNAQENASLESIAALKLQKVYRSYRTRRRLADSAVVAEELWWQAIDFARLNHSTISFFNFMKQETAASRWNRMRLNASKVGKGLSKDAKAQKLAFQHWIEAIDPRHRYGHNLHMYYEAWCKAEAGQPFFYWLDIGDGKEVDLKECPRSKLRKQCIKYLGPQEREHHEFIIVEGKIVHKQTGLLLDTNEGSEGAKWIFVMSAFHQFYAGEKKKGNFHHSSFLAGGATLAAGRLDVENGVLKSISAYSGHYRPTDENLESFLSFLKGNGVNLDEVQIHSTEDYDIYEENKSVVEASTSKNPTESKPPQLEIPSELAKNQPSEFSEVAQTKNKGYSRTLSGGLQSPRAEVPKTAILKRINSKKAACSYQLGKQLSLKWSSGAGPRIGCIADYPIELRLQALEFVNLSPRVPATPSSCREVGLFSPTAYSASEC